jgi:hypothetical protein
MHTFTHLTPPPNIIFHSLKTKLFAVYLAFVLLELLKQRFVFSVLTNERPLLQDMKDMLVIVVIQLMTVIGYKI